MLTGLDTNLGGVYPEFDGAGILSEAAFFNPGIPACIARFRRPAR
jgi:hypothetical protein